MATTNTKITVAMNPCPICESELTTEYLRRKAYNNEWIIRKCSSCSHGFVANRPSADRLTQIYSEGEHSSAKQATVEELEAGRGTLDMASHIARLTSERGRVLDVGSGEGGFSYHLAKVGFGPILMIDFDPGSALATNVVPDSTFKQCAFEELKDEGPFSAIVMSQVLEHALDPMDWLTRARDRLSRKGVLAIALPNFGGVYRMLGTRDPMLIPPVHLNHFSPKSMQIAIEKVGLEVVRMDSTSQVRTSAPDQNLSTKRIVLGKVWNIGARVLDRTTRGISLRAFAHVARE